MTFQRGFTVSERIGGLALKSLLETAESALRRIALLLTLCLLGACSTTSKFPEAPASASTQDYNYIIGAGDTLNIIVWRNPELSLSVPVRPDGKVTMPLVDELSVQGKNSVDV